jgi:hypothetical protein
MQPWAAMIWTRRVRLGVSFLSLSLLSSSARAAADDEGNDRTTPRLSALPFVGVNSYVDRAGYGPGPRAGTLLGVRLLPWLSLNGEVTYDKSWIQITESDNSSESFVDLALSPLFHWTHGDAEVVVGPEIGYFTSSFTAMSHAGGEFASSSSGLAIGLNLGVFAHLNRYVSLGGMLSFEARNARRYCETLAGQPQTCTTNQVLNSSVVLNDVHLVALAFAALF